MEVAVENNRKLRLELTQFEREIAVGYIKLALIDVKNRHNHGRINPTIKIAERVIEKLENAADVE